MDKNYNSLKLTGKIFATGVMSFCGVVSETAMNVTFPTLMNEFNIGTSTVQWITTGYLLVLSLVITLSSYLKRNFTSRTLFLFSISCFILGTLLCYAAPSFMMLLLGRVMQGAGTGVALPLMFNIILAEAPKERLGFFMGVGAIITAMAPAVGPILGGFIVDSYSWRIIFLVLSPFLLLSLILGITLIEPSFIVATVQASSSGWLSLEVGSLLLLSAVSMGFFVNLAARNANPLLSVSVLKHRQFVLALLSILFIQLSVLALGYIMPNYSQIVNHSGAFIAGTLMVPGCIIGAILTIVAGWVLDKFGAYRPIMIGNLLLVLSLILFSYYGVRLNEAMFYGFYIIFTTGEGLCIGNTMTYGLSKLPKELSADGNAFINSVQQLAGAVGTAVAATLVAAAQNKNMADIPHSTAIGAQHLFITLTVVLILSLVCAWQMFAYSAQHRKT